MQHLFGDKIVKLEKRSLDSQEFAQYYSLTGIIRNTKYDILFDFPTFFQRSTSDMDLKYPAVLD